MREKRRQIWVITLEYEPFIIGGLGTVATNLSKALARSGLQVTVLSRSPTSRFGITRKPRLSIIRFPKGPIYDRPAAAARWLMKRAFRKPDNIHIHSVQLANWAIFLRKKYKIPIFYTCHSLIAMEPGPLTKKRIIAESRQVQLLKIANKIVVPSRSELVHLKRRYPFSAKKTTVIKHGVAIRKSASRGPLHHLLYVGRLVPMKGLVQLLQAVALLSRKSKKVRLFLVGTGPKGYTRHLKALAKKYGIASRVHWLGYRRQRQVQSMYASFGAVVMPSRRESFGLVALEAMGCGIPLVATRSGGLAEIVNRKTAQVIPRVEKRAIAGAIQRMWRNRKATRQRMIAARKLAARYSWPQAARRYKRLFQQSWKR